MVFEPNDETLWSALRLQVGRFMEKLAREGAFSDYNVSCDATTTTADDLDRGVVNILVQFAPVHPAEFITIQIQQVAGGRALGAWNPPTHSPGLRSIALVTAAIAGRVGTAIAGAVPGAAVRVGTPRAAPAGEIEACVTLYRVTPNDPSRNAAPAVLAAEGSAAQRSPAVLDLHYLLTFASDRPFAVDLMVASVVCAFHEAPQIERAELIAAADRVPGAAFADFSTALQPESLTMDQYLALSAASPSGPGVFLSYVVPGIALGAEMPVPSA